MINAVLGAVGRFFIAAGVILLLFTAFQLWGTGLGEASEQRDLTRELAAEVGVDLGPSGGDDADPEIVAQQITDQLETLDPTTAEPTAPPPEGDAAGFIEIPKIDLRDKAFVEGVSKKDLRKGPGHYPGTALPGQPGNASIAGHRTTYGAPFNRIDELVPGDVINVFTPQGKFVYEVTAPEPGRSDVAGPGWFAVPPSDVSVIAPTADNRLTLTACHPKYSARLRIIVTARLLGQAAPAAPVVTSPTTTVPAGEEPDEEPDESVVERPDATADLIAGDAGELTPTLWFGGALAVSWLAVIALVSVLRTRYPKIALAYVAYFPVGALLLWNAFLHLDRYLPSF